MLKVLAFGLSLSIMACPFAAYAQYGKVQGVVPPVGVQAVPANDGANASGSDANQKANNVSSAKANTTAANVRESNNEKVEIFFDDFSIKKTLGGQIFCQMTFYVRNNTEKMLDSLIASINWSGISTKVSFAAVEPKDVKDVRYALAGSGCYTMGEEPTLEVERCLMRAVTPGGKVTDVPEDVCRKTVIFK